MNVVTMTATSDRVHANETVYVELHEFLDDEAALLDNDRLTEWLNSWPMISCTVRRCG